VKDSTISGNGEGGVFNGGGSQDSLSIKNSMVNDNGWGGVGAGKVKIQDSEVLNNGMTLFTYGVYAADKASILRSRVENNNGDGVFSDGGNLLDSTVLSNTGHGVDGGFILKVKRTTVSNNTEDGCRSIGKTILIDATANDNGGSGAFSRGYVKAIRSTLTGNNRGIYVDSGILNVGKISLVGSTVTGNLRDGIVGEDGTETVSIITVDSNATGNGTDPACNIAPVVCADVVAGAEVPNFDLVPGTYECGTSFVLGTGYQPCGDCPPGLFPGLSFGICLEDCQNSTLNGAEVCDDGGFSATCDNNCTPQACGDLTTNPAAGEECDDGDLDENDACKNDCSLNVCGDGVIRTGVEQCDDGNTTSGDGCSSTCQNEP
jgi:cysteine-rich repeat protein